MRLCQYPKQAWKHMPRDWVWTGGWDSLCLLTCNISHDLGWALFL